MEAEEKGTDPQTISHVAKYLGLNTFRTESIRQAHAVTVHSPIYMH